MNIAYCIICHRNTPILRAAIHLLSPANTVYLHVDLKSNLDEFEEYRNQVVFVKQRIDVRWARFSQVECTLSLLKEIEHTTYHYMCLLSGDDLPLKSSTAIKEFFREHSGTEFLGIQADFRPQTLIDRVQYLHSEFDSKRNKAFWEHCFSAFKKFFLKRKKNPLFPKLPPLHKGSNWFCLSREACTFILRYLKENPWYTEAFRFSHCGDEIFFHTLLMNSRFKDRLYKHNELSDDNAKALRYIDWRSGPDYPKILTEQDLAMLTDSNFLFARKFSEHTDLNTYYEWLKSRS